MISGFGWAALALLFGYLALFFWGGTVAVQAAGCPVWLFSRAKGRDHLAAMAFRTAFSLTVFGPLLWLGFGRLHKLDPFWTEGHAITLGLVGVFVAGPDVMGAFAAQVSMDSSWTVGVIADETGQLVSSGLYRFSRNPTFAGQAALLAMDRPQARGNKMTKTQLLFLMAAAMLADQMTKAVALSLLSHGKTVAVLPGFNEGAGFGMMSGIMTGKPLLMAALTGVVPLALLAIALRAKDPIERMGFALIMGGSLCNIFDNLQQGAVTDFLDFCWRDWHWPVFNLADIAITMGAVLMLFASLSVRHKKPHLDPSSAARPVVQQHRSDSRLRDRACGNAGRTLHRKGAWSNAL